MNKWGHRSFSGTITAQIVPWIRIRLSSTWRQKGPVILLLPLLISIQTSLPLSELLPQFMCAMATIAGLITVGYLINDLSDQKEDIRAGKIYPWSATKPAIWSGIMAGALAISLVPWCFLEHGRYSYVGLAVEALLLAVYSLPPLRLKHNKYASVLLDATYAYTVPCLLAGYTFYLFTGSKGHVPWLICGIWASLLGIRHYLNHLSLDRLNDQKSSNSTLATRYGNHTLRLVAAEWILPLEIVCLSSTIGYIYLDSTLFPLIVLPISLFLGYLIHHFYTSEKYSFTGTRIDKLYGYLPLGLVLIAATKELSYLWLILVYQVAFYRISSSNPLLQTLRKPISAIVNYGIYYARRYVRLQSEQQARREHYTSYLADKERQLKSKNVGALAVINQHRKKYTETFIWEEFSALPCAIYHLHGGLLPQYVGDGSPLLSQVPWQRAASRLYCEIRKKSPDYYLEKAICRFLIREHVQALLVHFGPSALRMVPISKSTGLPLIAYMHGYDVHHKKVQEEIGKNYPILFQHAALLLCASHDIKAQLIVQGAPAHKLRVLPGYVKLSNFPYSDHSKKPPHLLFVGRFCETKSPHLLLIAFAELRKILPKARLTLIGQDGGGELFEACLIQAKAMRIDKFVRFLGVCSHEEVAMHMKRARALVQPSLTTPIQRDKEGTPVAIMEAAAAGLPIISTHHAGIAEIITHNKEGLLVKEYDLKALTKAMFRICTDDNLSKRLGKAASERIRQDPRISLHHRHLYRHIKSTFRL